MINIVRRLPSSSHFAAAQKNDPEFAAWVVASSTEDTKWAPLPTEWGLDRELMAAVLDRVGDLTAAVITSFSREVVQPPSRYPRPVTEIEKAKARIGDHIERELAALVDQAHETYSREHP